MNSGRNDAAPSAPAGGGARDHEARDGPVHGDKEPREGGGGRGILWAIASVAVLALGAGVFAFLTLSGAEEETVAPEPPLVRTAEVEGAERLTLSQTAFVRPRREVAVAAEVSARIAEVGETFRLGERVAEGDLLIRLEDARFRADVARAEAAVEQARAALAEARVARGRQEELEAREFASEATLEEAIVSVASAEADLAAARADLETARIALDDTTVEAPFDAFVTEENAAVGSLIEAGADVGTLVGADAVEVLMGLTPSDIAILGDPARAVGGLVAVRSTDPEPLFLREGTVVDVDPRVVADTRTVALVVEIARPFDGGPRPLRIGELVEVVLPVSLANREAVRVPPEAVKGRDTVWRVEDGRIRRLDVRVVERGESRVVLSGEALSPGDAVMVSDVSAPFDGKTVRVEGADRDRGAAP